MFNMCTEADKGYLLKKKKSQKLEGKNVCQKYEKKRLLYLLFLQIKKHVSCSLLNKCHAAEVPQT